MAKSVGNQLRRINFRGERVYHENHENLYNTKFNTRTVYQLNNAIFFNSRNVNTIGTLDPPTRIFMCYDKAWRDFLINKKHDASAGCLESLECRNNPDQPE